MVVPLWAAGVVCRIGGQGAVDAVQVRAHLDLLLERTKLRQLGYELGAILRRRRILILQLCDQQLQERSARS